MPAVNELEIFSDLGPAVNHFYEISNFGPFDLGKIYVRISYTVFLLRLIEFLHNLG